MSSLLERLFNRGMRTADPGPKGEGRPPVPYADERRRSARGIAADADEGVSSPSRPEVCPLEPRLFLAATTLAGFADLALNENQSAFSMSLAGHFDDPAIIGTLVDINTVMGVIPVELFNVQVGAYTAAPLTVTNFLHHANSDPLTSTTYYSSYDNTIFHRSAPGSVDPVTHLDPSGQPGFVIQGGGYDYPSFTKVTEGPTVANEYSVTRSNLRGTVAMAKLGSDPNSATNQFFINLSDNSSNLDNQNGGFTVFGHVVGSGMTVADAIAELPVYNGTSIDSAFDNLPLRNTPPAQAGPNNVVLINSIRVVDKLSYTATTDTPTLLSLSVSGTGLTINFMPNQTGTAHVTIRATDVDGTYVESTFAVAVNTAVNPPSIESLAASPDPFERGAQLTLTAKSVASFPGKTVTKVEFFRDSNGNGLLEPGTDQYLGDGTKNASDWTIQPATIGWTPGPTKFFARAQDSSTTGSSPSAVTALIVNIPPSLTKIYTMGTLLRNQTGYISAQLLKNLQYPNYSYSDAWDANGDTISFRVEKISSGTMTKDGQPVVEGVTIFGPGEYVTWTPDSNADGTVDAFQVRAWDGTAASDKPIQIKIIVDKPPTIGGVAVGPKIISMPGGTVTLVASANDPDGKVAKVEFFYDTNNNGTFDEDTDLKLGEDTKVLGNWALFVNKDTDGDGLVDLTKDFRTGVARFFVRATDNVDGTSAIYTVTSFVNTPPTIASVTSSGPVDRGDSLLLTAANVTDAGTVTGVQFFLDVNADGKITTADKLLGSGKLVPGTSDWTLTASTAGWGWSAGGNQIIARATDNNGGTSTATGTATTNNHAPTASNLKVLTNPVSQPGGTLKLTAAAKDVDGTIAKVMFFYDFDKNGLLEMPNDLMLGQTLAGAGGVWTLVTTNTASLALGDARYFAVAVDNDGATSTPVAAVGTVNTPPVIDSVTTSGPVLRGSKLTLRAMNVHDVGTGNSVKKVEFFRDVNGNNIIDAADKLVGAGAVAAGTSNYSLTISTAGLPVGDAKFIARATDNNGGMTTAIGTATILNNVPTLASLAPSAATVKRGAPVTLTAKGPADVDGKVAKVEFFWDTNGNGVFDDGTDLKIGEDTNSLGGYTLAYMVPPTADLGAMRFFARATDNDGGVGAPVSIAITAANVNPTVGSLTVAPNPVTKPAPITLTAASVVNPDGDGLIQRLRFYEDVNKNNVVDAGDRLLGEDTDGSDGWSLTIPSSDVMGTGAVRFLAVADDNDGGSSVAKVGTSTINA